MLGLVDPTPSTARAAYVPVAPNEPLNVPAPQVRSVGSGSPAQDTRPAAFVYATMTESPSCEAATAGGVSTPAAQGLGPFHDAPWSSDHSMYPLAPGKAAPYR